MINSNRKVCVVSEISANPLANVGVKVSDEF